MVNRLVLLLFVVWVAGVCAWAQPAAEESWLLVRVLGTDGKPFPTTPTVSMYRLEGKTRTYAGRPYLAGPNAACVTGLIPGTYEATLIFRAYGLVDGPKQVEVKRGFNEMDWTVPAVVQAGGDLLVDGQSAPVPKRITAFLMPVGKYSPQPAWCKLDKASYKLFGVFPGAYKLLVLTESMYGISEFTAAENQPDPAKAPVELKPGGILNLEVSGTTTDGTVFPLASASVYLSCTVDKGFAPSIILYTDGAGKLTTPALPPGNWRYTIYYTLYQTASGTVTVAAGMNPPLTANLKQTP